MACLLHGLPRFTNDVIATVPKDLFRQVNPKRHHISYQLPAHSGVQSASSNQADVGMFAHVLVPLLYHLQPVREVRLGVKLHMITGCPGPLPRSLAQTNNLLATASMSGPAPQAALEEAGLLPHAASMPPALYSQPPLLHAAMSSGTMSGSSGSNPNIIEHNYSDAEVSGHSTSHSLSDLEGPSGSPQSVLRDRYDPEAAIHSQPPSKPSPKLDRAPLQQSWNAIAEHPDIGSPVHLVPLPLARDHPEQQMTGPAAAHFIPIPPVQSLAEQQGTEPTGPGLSKMSPRTTELLEGVGNDRNSRFRLTRRPDEPRFTATMPGANDLLASYQASAQQSEQQHLQLASTRRHHVVEQASPPPGHGQRPQSKKTGKPDAASSFCFRHDVKLPSKKAFMQCWGA